jgi:hypothetical protein
VLQEVRRAGANRSDYESRCLGFGFARSAVGASLGLLIACRPQPQEEPPKPPVSVVAAAATTQGESVVHYPRGKWRLATFDELDRVVVWVSQVVVMHDQSKPDIGSTAPALASWEDSNPLPKRSRAEALKIAQTVATEAARDAGSFGQLAQRYSDDIATRGRGGSFGGTRASQLPEFFLDALQAVGRGKITGVIETPLGFYVLSWRLPPREEQVAGQHIVIPYIRNAIQAELFRTRRTRRTRQQAVAIAQQVLSSQKPFAALAKQYSEAEDRELDGDMGVWSSIAPLYNGAAVEVLTGLAVGEVSSPVDTGMNIQIITRVPVTPRATYAVKALLIRYSLEDKGNGPGSRNAAAKQAKGLIRRLRGEPGAFDKLYDETGDHARLQWVQGTDNIPLERVVRKLAVGELAKSATDYGACFLIAKRIEPVAQPALLYELPEPQGPNIEAYLRSNSPETMAAQVRALRTAAPQGFRLPSEQQSKLDHCLQGLEERLAAATDPEARVEAYRANQRELQGLLGEQTFKNFDHFFQAWASWIVINQAPR